MKNDNKIKPFVKWVGGKTQLLDRLNLLIENINFDRVIEPFVGGGSFFIHQQKPSIINDINYELITTYQVIKNNLKPLINYLDELEANHSEEFFLKLRQENPIDISNDYEIAGRFIYLNKSGFNGMYRVNSKGEFNVPFGKKEKVSIYDKDNLNKLHNYFKNIKIYNKNYKEVIKKANKDDLVFVDPPYDKLTKSSFVSYDKNGFNEKDQIELCNELKKLNEKGIKWILTNHNTPLINELYKEFNKITIPVKRFISENAFSRTNGNEESIIFNFDISEETKKKIKFENLLTMMRQTNMSPKDLVDWKKIFNIHMKKHEYFINILNYLICSGKRELEKRIKEIIDKNNETFNFLPLLLAFRKTEKPEEFDFIDDKGKEFKFYKAKNERFTFEEVNKFIYDSGLDILFLKEIKSNNLKEYLLGVEVGLNSNARKNLSGKNNEKMMEYLLDKYEINYQKECYIDEYPKRKKFDYKFNLNNKNYLLEINFYNGSGSKLNEVSKSYIKVNEEVNKLDGYEFIWVTDGKGWKNTRNQLWEAFIEIKNLFNYWSFEKFLINEIKKQDMNIKYFETVTKSKNKYLN